MQLTIQRDPLNRCDFSTLILDRESKAGKDALPAHQHGARTASALIAALLRTMKLKVFAEKIEERGPDVEIGFNRFSIDDKMHKVLGRKQSQSNVLTVSFRQKALGIHET